MVHIGAYELIRVYHDWPKRTTLHTSEHPRTLKKELGGGSIGANPALDYYRAMVRFYQSVPTS